MSWFFEACAAILCSTAAILSAQTAAPPGIGQNGVVNAASRIPPTLAGGDLARSARITISGVRLGSAGHTIVTLSSGGHAVGLKLMSLTPERIDALVPSLAPLGKGSLTVSVDGQAAPPFPVRIEASNPGLFSSNGLGWGPGVIYSIDSRGARHANSTSNPAHPGEHIWLRATGLGSLKTVRMMIGNRIVQGDIPRREPEPGIQEISATIPDDGLQGCYVPVYLLSSPLRASNAVTISIRSGAGPCDPGALPLLDASRIAVAVISRTRNIGRDAKRESVADEAAMTFAAKDAGPVQLPLMLLPPPGSCTAYTGSFEENAFLPGSITDALMQELEGRGLDAGPLLTFTRERASRTVSHEHGITGYYRGRLGTSSKGRRRRPLFLERGEYTLSSKGGVDVGPFSVPFTGPTAFEWTNRDQTDAVDRARPLSIRWRGGRPEGVIVILATNVDQISTAIGSALCTAAAASGQFDVPAAMLANIPATQDEPGIPYDQLFVAQLPGGALPRIQASGVTGGTVMSIYSFTKFVRYR